jgi:hypothetical protein
LRALEIPFGLLATANQGAALFLQPTTRRLCTNGNERRAWKVVLWAAGTMVLAPVAIGIIILVVPAHDLQQVFGPSFRPNFNLVVAIILKYASFGPVMVMSIMARSLGARRETLPFAIGFTVLATILALVVATTSLAGAYLALYATLTLGSLEILRRLRGRAFSADTV